MRHLTLVHAVSLLLAGAGCAPAPSEVHLSEPRVAVHAVLVAEADSAVVLLARARAGGTFGSPAAFEPVDDASVYLVSSGDTLRLGGPATCPGQALGGDVPIAGCYTGAVPGGVRAGAVYDLIVDVPGAARIRGSTRVPRPAVIHAPLDSPVLSFSRAYQPEQPPTPVTVRWSGAEPLRHVQLRVATRQTDCQATLTVPGRLHGSLWIEAVGADSATIAPWYVACPQQAGVGEQAVAGEWRAEIVLSLYDENYSRYLASLGRGQSIMLNAAGAGMTGALGVFGAAANTRAEVVLVAR